MELFKTHRQVAGAAVLVPLSLHPITCLSPEQFHLLLVLAC